MFPALRKCNCTSIGAANFYLQTDEEEWKKCRPEFVVAGSLKSNIRQCERTTTKVPNVFLLWIKTTQCAHTYKRQPKFAKPQKRTLNATKMPTERTACKMLLQCPKTVRTVFPSLFCFALNFSTPWPWLDCVQSCWMWTKQTSLFVIILFWWMVLPCHCRGGSIATESSTSFRYLQDHHPPSLWPSSPSPPLGKSCSSNSLHGALYVRRHLVFRRMVLSNLTSSQYHVVLILCRSHLRVLSLEFLRKNRFTLVRLDTKRWTTQ